jgi:hypothetical protein
LRWCDSVLGTRAVPAGPQRARLGGRDPRLVPDRRLLQRTHRGDQPAPQEGERVGHGFRNFANYRLRLLHCGVTWQTPQTARLRGAHHVWRRRAGILSRLRFSDVDVEVQPAPLLTEEVERETTFIAIGSIGYNTASKEVENRFHPLATLDPSGFVVLPGNRPVGDSSFAVVQRLQDSSSGRSAFYVAGSSMEGTTAVGYLISKWRRLHKRYPKGQPFCIVLEALSADGRQYRQVFSRP